MSTGRPAKCTGMMARVFGVIAAGTRSRLMLRVYRSISTNTGWRAGGQRHGAGRENHGGDDDFIARADTGDFEGHFRPAVAEVMTRK